MRLMNKSSYEQELATHGRVISTNVGDSMMPLLRQGKDLMVIDRRPEGRCRKYDAVLYKRGDKYILHRILKVRKHDYVICGDHRIHREYGVTDEQIIGVLTAVVRDGKEIPVTAPKYRFYVHLWCDFYHIRAAILYTKRFFRHGIRKLRGKKDQKPQDINTPHVSPSATPATEGTTRPKVKLTTETALDFVTLTACGLHGRTPASGWVAQMDLPSLYALSRYHSMSALLCMALESAEKETSGVLNDTALWQRWRTDKDQAIRKGLLLDAERKALFSFMEQEGIWYMPLKGALLKDVYPKVGMRQMSDNDILFDVTHQAKIRDYFVGRGYTVEMYGKGRHDEYHKPPVYNFEMHHRLFREGNDRRWAAYYDHVKDRLIKDEGREYGYHFSDEEFYTYLIAHMYKHDKEGGTGIRSLSDVYVYVKAHGEHMDWTAVAASMEALGMTAFESRMRSLAFALLDVSENEAVETHVAQAWNRLSEDDKAFFDRLMRAGTYGTAGGKAQTKLEELQRDGGPITKATKRKYLRKRLFPDLEWFKDNKPFFYRHRWGIPFFWVYRLVKGLFCSRKAWKAEVRSVRNTK